MPRARRSSSLVSIILAVTACTAHEPPPRIHAPDEPAPALAEWKGPVAQPEEPEEPAPAQPEPAQPEPEALEPEQPPGPVKVAESPAEDAYESGKRSALAAIKDDSLGLETFGYPAPCRQQYRRILLRDYKVRLYEVAGCVIDDGILQHEVAGCVIDDGILQHARGYNEVMSQEIARRHGEDALERAAKKAGC
jgi:hypothetical protein